jgi:hypothetical protein
MAKGGRQRFLTRQRERNCLHKAVVQDPLCNDTCSTIHVITEITALLVLRHVAQAIEGYQQVISQIANPAWLITVSPKDSCINPDCVINS